MKFVDLMTVNNRWGHFTSLTIHVYRKDGNLPYKSLDVRYSEIPVKVYEYRVRWFNNDEVGIEAI